MAAADDWCQQSVVFVGQVDRQRERVDPSSASHFREELCTSVRRLCTRSAPRRVVSKEDWQERGDCGLQISCGR